MCYELWEVFTESNAGDFEFSLALNNINNLRLTCKADVEGGIVEVSLEDEIELKELYIQLKDYFLKKGGCDV